MAHAPNTFGITVHNATLRYGEQAIFDGLSLTLNAGEWVCLLGVSGVGKSSILSLLMQSPPSPYVTCTDHAPLMGRLAWMAQGDSLLPWKTVLDNVMLGATLRGEQPDSATALSLLGRVGLQGLEHRLPHQLSGGQRQRVALARTLSENTPVVLMDEPFSAVDAITRHGLQDTAHALLQGRTVLMVTHDPLESLRLADRILIMQSGGGLHEIIPPTKTKNVQGMPQPRPVDTPAIAPLHNTILTHLSPHPTPNTQGDLA